MTRSILRAMFFSLVEVTSVLVAYSYLFLHDMVMNQLSKKLIEKSRECHNHKPQAPLDTKRKRKMTKANTYKTNKQMHEKS